MEGGGVYQCSLSVMITRDYNYVVMRYEMVLSSIGGWEYVAIKTNL